jgi:DNA-binding XRE family transcriptional regulator
VDASEFAKRVRERKDELRLSQVELADRAGVSTSTVTKLLGRYPHVPERVTAIDLARALEWDPNEVLRWLDRDPMTEGERSALVAPVSATAERLKAMLRVWCRLPNSDQDVLMEVAALLESRIARRCRGVTLFEADPSVSPTGPQNCVRGGG